MFSFIGTLIWWLQKGFWDFTWVCSLLWLQIQGNGSVIWTEIHNTKPDLQTQKDSKCTTLWLGIKIP